MLIFVKCQFSNFDEIISLERLHLSSQEWDHANTLQKNRDQFMTIRQLVTDDVPKPTDLNDPFDDVSIALLEW